MLSQVQLQVLKRKSRRKPGANEARFESAGLQLLVREDPRSRTVGLLPQTELRVAYADIFRRRDVATSLGRLECAVGGRLRIRARWGKLPCDLPMPGLRVRGEGASPYGNKRDTGLTRQPFADRAILTA